VEDRHNSYDPDIHVFDTTTFEAIERLPVPGGPLETLFFQEYGDRSLDVTPDGSTLLANVGTAPNQDLALISIGPTDEADVFLTALRGSPLLSLREGETVARRILVSGDGDTLVQDATVTLAAEADASLAVTIEPAAVTESVAPGRPDTLFRFVTSVTCRETGDWDLDWTATIDAAENADPNNDTLTKATTVHCR
jgi:hypothetical protein